MFYVIDDRLSYVPATGDGFFPIIEDLRAGVFKIIHVEGIFGLITFPSFHAASAVLFAWANWSIRVYRWPMLLLNVGMLIATPIEGSHYLIDVIAGVLVATASIQLVRKFDRGLSTQSAVADTQFEELKASGGAEDALSACG
jgi:membrane-associated phospholipid phosphatase